MTDNPKILKTSKVKDFVSEGFRVSGEFNVALNDYVTDAIRKAEYRAKENGRKTLKAQDL